MTGILASNAEDTRRRLARARGHTVRGGRISSLGATGINLPHAATSTVQSNGRPSWVGRNR